MTKMIDMAGRVFVRWTVIERSGSTPGGMAIWRCRCSCGTEKNVHGADLRSGKNTSCGCKRNERIGALRRTHAQSKTRLHRIWQGMRKRCYDKNQPMYPTYGGKGITVFDGWQTYVVFEQWARANGYADDLSIDRINNNLGYFPQNCRWATPLMQTLNRRPTRRTADGRPGCVVAAENGITRQAYRGRVDRGWDIDEAATRPMMRARRPK